MRNGKIRVLSLITLAVLLISCGSNSTFVYDAKSAEADINAVFFTAEGDFFYKTENGIKEKFLIKGINIGTGIPGAFPNDKKIDKETYLRWLGLISEMNVNAFRVYTIQDDAFYEALYEFNAGNDKPLYFFQGFYNSESLYTEYQNAFAEPIINEIETFVPFMVDIVHGNKPNTEYINEKFQSGINTTGADVSPWLIGYIVGIETDEEFVENTNAQNPDKKDFSGEFFKAAPGASPYENYLAFMFETAIAYEQETYGEQHPISFTNWPTTDPLSHPNEPYEIEDGTTVDAEHIYTSDKFTAGMFASYHNYPYYPTFMYYGDKYQTYVNKYGEIDPYMGYLVDLKAHHNMPVLVAEYGLSTSRGLNHLNWVTGYSQGRLTEKEQGEMDAHLFRDIVDANYAGGMVFTWQDEWFKRSWNTSDFNEEATRPYWSNIEASEQMYGLMSFDPGYLKTFCQTDGDISEWEKQKAAFEGGSGELKIKSDERYVYFLISDSEMTADSKYIIGIDTIQDQGNKTYSGKNIYFNNYCDFAIVISGEDNAVYVDSYYDTYIKYYINSGMFKDRLSESNQTDKYTGVFNPVRLGLVRPLTFPVTGEQLPSKIHVTGNLTEGNSNPESDNFNSLADFYRADKAIEIRIPWALLNFSDPANGRIIDDFTKREYFELKSITIDEIGVELHKDSGGGFENIGIGTYELAPWGEFPEWNERLKESYYIMKEAYAGY
jgi:hypothetical protein